MSADFLLELLSEEIPARMQARARNDLARMFAEALTAAAEEVVERRDLAGTARAAALAFGLLAPRSARPLRRFASLRLATAGRPPWSLDVAEEGSRPWPQPRKTYHEPTIGTELAKNRGKHYVARR